MCQKMHRPVKQKPSTSRCILYKELLCYYNLLLKVMFEEISIFLSFVIAA